MKLTKEMLTEMVKEVIQEQMKETGPSATFDKTGPRPLTRAKPKSVVNKPKHIQHMEKVVKRYMELENVDSAQIEMMLREMWLDGFKFGRKKV